MSTLTEQKKFEITQGVQVNTLMWMMAAMIATHPDPKALLKAFQEMRERQMDLEAPSIMMLDELSPNFKFVLKEMKRLGDGLEEAVAVAAAGN